MSGNVTVAKVSRPRPRLVRNERRDCDGSADRKILGSDFCVAPVDFKMRVKFQVTPTWQERNSFELIPHIENALKLVVFGEQLGRVLIYYTHFRIPHHHPVRHEVRNQLRPMLRVVSNSWNLLSDRHNLGRTE